ncbi:MAG: carbon starvation protein A [Lentisphaerae bacterium]|nr:carbon starvation protein A [Lentisphaerota bacterium]
MKLFLTGLLILAAGYFLYGSIVKKIIRPDDRQTPALTSFDGVDYLVLPNWKNMLIQLLNIAGIGPVIGVIGGILFGDIVFIIIPVGCVLMGAVHDFIAGMMSIRNNGANLTELIRLTAGKHLYRIFSAFLVIALLLVVAVFINVPAKLSSGLLGGGNSAFFWSVIGIFIYYICATMFPVDKIIGKVYPIFGALLLLGTAGLLVMLMIKAVQDPSLLVESEAFKSKMFTASDHKPILPLLFVTIACGILSGFHATQAPIVARTIKSEKEAFGVFFGMMIVEGFIAMVWSAGALAIYNMYPELIGTDPNGVLAKITNTFLKGNFSTVVVLSVIVLAITSGDTAMRSLRLSLAEMFHIDQKPLLPRIMLVLPLIVITAGLLFWSNKDGGSFQKLWTYFAWSNQVIAAFALLAAAIWLFAQKRPAFIAVMPGMFITFIVATYILWISPEHGGPVGLGLELYDAYMIAAFIAVCTFAWAKVRAAELEDKFQNNADLWKKTEK